MARTTEEILLPLLQYLGDGEIHTITSSVLHLVESLKLTNIEKNEFYASRKSSTNEPDLSSTKFYIRVADAIHVLRKAKLLKDFPKIRNEGIFSISHSGVIMLNQNKNEITNTIASIFFKKYSKTKMLL